jgi:polyhydroxyalkanoate synthesis regulator phasin
MVKVCIKDIHHNPFKKFINDGKLEEDRVEKLVESIEHGTLQPNFVGRKNDKDQWEISSGHHRLGAFKKKFGEDFKVELMKANFSDEQMLVDMVRENLTQRGEGSFRDTEESIVLARNWVLSKSRDSKSFGNRLRDNKGHFQGQQPVNGSARSIAEFLSKNGKAVSIETVRQYLNIHDKLDKNLHKKIENLERKANEVSTDNIGVSIAGTLTMLDKKTQRKAWEDIKKYELNNENARKYISKLKSDNTITPEIITKQQIQEEFESNINQSIDFKNHWAKVSSGYQEDLIHWRHYPAKLSKPDLKKLYNTILMIHKEETKTLKKLEELVE